VVHDFRKQILISKDVQEELLSGKGGSKECLTQGPKVVTERDGVWCQRPLGPPKAVPGC
jgi:hypothetical protein